MTIILLTLYEKEGIYEIYYLILYKNTKLIIYNIMGVKDQNVC